MAIRDLIPWRRTGARLPVRRAGNPYLALQNEMNRIFDRLLGAWDLEPFDRWPTFAASFAPSVDVTETDKEVRVQAELPGMDEKDIEVTLANGILTIQGEKREEREEKDAGSWCSECRYGRFHREIALPTQVDEAKATATLTKGVLTVTLPKTPEAQDRRKRIQIKSGS